ncbi:MAG TPA: SLBB domain-containing protein [Longimicrobium sp.]|nr:SLBB domain-containing protein [Longimicrobium sp.]
MTRFHSRRAAAPAARALLAAAAAALLLPCGGAAQDPAAADTTPATPVRRTAADGAARDDERLPVPLLDAPVSRTEYRLGAGDAVDVAIFGDINEVHTISVSPEGSLLVPGIGIARVLGLNLDEAQARVRDLVARYYRSAEVRLALSRVRTFKVFVVGDVPTPGMRVATAATRVSEVLDGAGGGRATQRRRNVLLRRAGGDSVAVDLVRFLQTGDLSANPTVREGDAVVVPVQQAEVRVSGRVHYPGAYEFRPGETLAEFLAVVNGGAGFPANAADTVRLVRFSGAHQATDLLFSRAEATGPRGRAFRLEPFDALFVPEVVHYRRTSTVEITGEVMRPGTYPIRPDTTTVRDLVAMAGGLAPRASLVEATLRRPVQQAAQREELAAIPPELLSQEERRILQIRSQADAGQVVVNFARIFAEGGDVYDVPLQRGDYLHIPERRNEVTVLGAVRTPGIVPYTPGQGVTYFVREAGGFARRADRGDVVVLRGPSGTRMDWREVPQLDPGDTVVVPYEERLTWSEVLRNTNAIVGTLTGIIFVALAIL